MADIDAVTATEALARARAADLEIWSASGGTGHRRLRDAAVLDAVRAGAPVERVAQELGVLVRDVERMITAAGTAAPERVSSRGTPRTP